MPAEGAEGNASAGVITALCNEASSRGAGRV